MKKDVLVVLGSPNSAHGELSEISKSRLDYCRTVFRNGQFVLLTGGWGDHFNTSEKPHAYYGRQYLMEKGLPENIFLEFAMSKNTVDDAVQIKSILAEPNHSKLTVITSDYHKERVEIIFQEILDQYEIKIVGVESNLEEKQIQALLNHEKKAIKSIAQNGLYY